MISTSVAKQDNIKRKTTIKKNDKYSRKLTGISDWIIAKYNFLKEKKLCQRSKLCSSSSL
jgi:hypothetical protein